MKRLVVCCDGTWKTAKDPHISNIEKIARAIRTGADGETVQVVHYFNGVGTGATWFDRVIGGAFGSGLNMNLIDAYRFLVLNYEPGDEIFVFGFSRGAYTARSLVGMIGKVGLLTAEALARSGDINLLDEALKHYRDRSRGTNQQDRPVHGAQIPDLRPFTHGANSPESLPRIRFIGVFDTVGALGVPGISRHKYEFLDVKLSNSVDVARQALAIDEQRLTFDPCVWTRDTNTRTDLKQVWFEGVHSDIGGGLARPEPSELSLAWMVREATNAGLDFDFERFPPLTDAGVSPLDKRYATNDSMKWGYRVINLVKLGVRSVGIGKRVANRHKGQSRLLEILDDSASPLYIADYAYLRWRDLPTRENQAHNIGWWDDLIGGDGLANRVVTIPPLAPAQSP
ncbi:DUF2235 domain-containing protein [Gordonia rhizosphera]|uniref:T6SS Phospholipase effector Tle1-like catalytic domain-containing protein n=1 Tax=Gordonia rhizosphera NBRC 16068 TaxID=1108045 RepID=K6V449_9ACTN|nr:DUF2235 domain-containing protein [Gordonia rhizosphera]GAB90873.1 hypothetical protein GORHZ_118_00900 [Gordonia rhizosphera NBRC 16068]